MIHASPPPFLFTNAVKCHGRQGRSVKVGFRYEHKLSSHSEGFLEERNCITVASMMQNIMKDYHSIRRSHSWVVSYFGASVSVGVCTFCAL